MTSPILALENFTPLEPQTLAKAMYGALALAVQHQKAYLETLALGETRVAHLESLRSIAVRGRNECQLLANDPSYTTDWNDPQRLLDILNLFLMVIASGKQQKIEIDALWGALQTRGEGK